MDFETYQKQARKTAIYPDLGNNNIYPTLGLVGEAGEVAEKVKKVLRDKSGIFDDKSKQEIKILSLIWVIEPGGLFNGSLTNLVSYIFNLLPFNNVKAPGFRASALTFEWILCADSFQLILQKDLSILGAYVAFLSFCSKALKLGSLILSNDLSNNSAPLVDIFFERLS